jgi:hypothetical protein
MLDESLSQATRDIASERCTTELRLLFAHQRARIERQIEVSMDSNTYSIVFERLGISADDAGNIRDR